MEKHLHIVSFSIPFPANYGGIIDVFYKIKALHEIGIKITLHCYEYSRTPAKELESFCEKVYYYRRSTSFWANISLLPYIVISRKNTDLLNNLCQNNYPILIEGIHCSYYLKNNKLKNRFILFRSANVEHVYYWHLFKSEKRITLKKIFYLVEAFRLLLYQKRLKKTDYILPISFKETDYFRSQFPENKVVFLPAFHSNTQVLCKEGKGSYALYNGNLSVAENEKAALFLIKKVFNNLNYPLVIAGLNPSVQLKQCIKENKNCTLVENPSDERMHDLIQNAHINILVTFQSTGLKLKLLNVLYKGRFCIANNKMLAGSGLESLCIQANSPTEIKTAITVLFSQDFTQKEIETRKKILSPLYSNAKSAQILSTLLDEQSYHFQNK